MQEHMENYVSNASLTNERREIVKVLTQKGVLVVRFYLSACQPAIQRDSKSNNIGSITFHTLAASFCPVRYISYSLPNPSFSFLVSGFIHSYIIHYIHSLLPFLHVKQHLYLGFWWY